jgi:hypothetical protein
MTQYVNHCVSSSFVADSIAFILQLEWLNRLNYQKWAFETVFHDF